MTANVSNLNRIILKQTNVQGPELCNYEHGAINMFNCTLISY